jgi:hypothetical protein
MFSGQAPTQQPNALLPVQIAAPDGQLSLFADYNAVGKDGVPLYLVNRTGRTIQFSGQDGDIYIKLESRMSDGRWQRAQAHSNSFCGNSYTPVSLPPGQHLLLKGYQPPDGRPAKVRFTMQNGEALVSNVGDGLVAQQDLDDAARDDMVRERVPFSYTLASFDELFRPEASDPNFWNDRVAALRLIAQWEENGYYRLHAQRLLSEAEKLDQPDARTAAKAIKEILGQTWPAEASITRFVAQCAAVLQAPRVSPSAQGALAGNHSMVWQVLRELAGGSHVTSIRLSSRWPWDTQLWHPIVALARDAVGIGQDDAISSFLGIPRLADELIDDKFFEDHLGSSNASIHAMSAMALKRRGRWTKLVELGRKLPTTHQMNILAELASHPADDDMRERPRPPDSGAQEEEFWLHCLRAEPLRSAYILRWAGMESMDSARNPYPLFVHDAVRDFLEKAAGSSDGMKEDFPLKGDSYDWHCAIEMLASWGRNEDIPLLEKLLEHRGYVTSQSSNGEDKSLVEHIYPLRSSAKRALHKFGKSPPDDTVLKKTVSSSVAPVNSK